MHRRIWAITKKEFIHLIRDWWLPAFMLIGGVSELLLVGWATSRPITNLPIMILDADKGYASQEVTDLLLNTGTFSLLEYVNEPEKIQTAMENGDINAAFIFPSGFSEQYTSQNQQAKLIVYLNGAESIPAMTVQRAVSGVIQEHQEDLIISQIGLSEERVSGFFPSLRVWFNEKLSEALYTTPAELGLMLEFTTLLFAALAFSRERELGTLEQLLVLPFSTFEIILGKSIPVILIGFSDFLLMLLMVNLAFDVPVRGSLVLLFILAFIYLLVELSKGMVISVVAKSQHQAFLMVLLVGMADFMFTGYAAPVESMPQILQTLANLIPAHHWMSILRGILLKNTGIEFLWPNVLAMVFLLIIIGGFSWRFVRRALD